MDLFFVVCGTLFILFLFNLLNFILKPNNINKWFICLCFLLLCIFDCFSNFEILNIQLNAKIILLFAVFLLFLFTLKSPKKYVLFLVLSLICLAVLIGYSSLDLTSYSLNYVKPYIFLAIIMGAIFKFFIQDAKTLFCGTFLGSIIFDFVNFKLSLSYIDNYLILGSNLAVEFVVFSFISYLIFSSLIFYAKKFKTFILKQKVKT